MKTLITLVALFFSVTLSAQQQPLITSEKVEALNTYIDYFEEHDQLVGSVSIASAGEEILYRSFGEVEGGFDTIRDKTRDNRFYN